MSDLALAELARAAYTEAPSISGSGPFRGTHALAGTDPAGELAIAFRGTDDPSDWIVDLMAIPQLTYRSADLVKLCFVHRGFFLAAASVTKQVQAMVGKAPYSLAGHSLGGAIALIVGSVLSRDTALRRIVTFGAPKVGFDAFASTLNGVEVRQYRRGNDPVTTLPIALRLFPYRHARLPLLPIGAANDSNPFACHSMAGYVEDLKGS